MAVLMPLSITIGDRSYTPINLTPTKAPTEYPSASPTILPTGAPSIAPTSKPTRAPSIAPSASPTAAPTSKPTPGPSPAPSPRPSPAPSPRPSPVPTPVPTPGSASCWAFTSSTLYYGGALGGIAGANAKCQALAEAGILPSVGPWKAWLADSANGMNPASTFLRSDIHIRLPGYPFVYLAQNWTDLTQSPPALSAFPLRDEYGFHINESFLVWTGVNGQGGSTGFDCNGWTDMDAVGGGTMGLANHANVMWTNAFNASCGNATLGRLYCMAQNCTGTAAPPSYAPTNAPTRVPSFAPSGVPSAAPSNAPTAAPVGPPTWLPVPNSCYAFVSNGTYTGGQLANGDAICTAEAAASPLLALNGATPWFAWLSNSTQGARDRVAPSQSTYRRPDNVVLALNFSYVYDGGLDNPLHVGSDGYDVAVDVGVWTGTNAAGGSTGQDCAGWTDSTSGSSGTVGFEGSVTTWTDNVAPVVCSSLRRVYCFQGNCLAPFTEPPTPSPTATPTSLPTATPTASPTTAAFATGCPVFITSLRYNGNLGGVAGAHALCAARAATSVEPNIGNYTNWRAWITSTSLDQPAATLALQSTAYKLATGTTVVADGGDFFTGGGLLNAINRDENGNAVSSPTPVWTSTSSSGTGPTGLSHCSGWTSTDNTALGRVGDGTSVADPDWTDTGAGGAQTCDQTAHLYCISLDCATPPPTTAPTAAPTTSSPTASPTV